MRKFILLLVITGCLFASSYRFMYWNMENLFDLKDDPLTRDEDYVPISGKRFTYRAYQLKMEHAAQGVNQLCPHILAMVEVENRHVLEDLRSRLINGKYYDILIEDGPDLRGIDPAVLYDRRFFFCKRVMYHPVYFEEEDYHSRDIMQVDLICRSNNRTLSVFVNHWPSRRGGKAKSDVRRIFAAGCLEDAVRRCLKKNPAAIVLMTGDFNDDKNDSCLQHLIRSAGFIYLTKNAPEGIQGTYCHNGEWVSFDHFLTTASASDRFNDARILAPFWMREKKTQGPRRFYKGQTIEGGYSDHYPIAINLRFP